MFMDQIGNPNGYKKSIEIGIHLDINQPYVGSTPDCILNNDSNEKIPVEVKSSFKYKGKILKKILFYKN